MSILRKCKLCFGLGSMCFVPLFALACETNDATELTKLVSELQKATSTTLEGNRFLSLNYPSLTVVAPEVLGITIQTVHPFQIFVQKQANQPLVSYQIQTKTGEIMIEKIDVYVANSQSDTKNLELTKQKLSNLRYVNETWSLFHASTFNNSLHENMPFSDWEGATPALDGTISVQFAKASNSDIVSYFVSSNNLFNQTLNFDVQVYGTSRQVTYNKQILSAKNSFARLTTSTLTVDNFYEQELENEPWSIAEMRLGLEPIDQSLMKDVIINVSKHKGLTVTYQFWHPNFPIVSWRVNVHEFDNYLWIEKVKEQIQALQTTYLASHDFVHASLDPTSLREHSLVATSLGLDYQLTFGSDIKDVLVEKQGLSNLLTFTIIRTNPKLASHTFQVQITHSQSDEKFLNEAINSLNVLSTTSIFDFLGQEFSRKNLAPSSAGMLLGVNLSNLSEQITLDLDKIAWQKTITYVMNIGYFQQSKTGTIHITLSNGDTSFLNGIRFRLLEVTSSALTYDVFNNLSLPTYTNWDNEVLKLNLSDDSIRYLTSAIETHGLIIKVRKDANRSVLWYTISRPNQMSIDQNFQVLIDNFASI